MEKLKKGRSQHISNLIFLGKFNLGVAGLLALLLGVMYMSGEGGYYIKDLLDATLDLFITIFKVVGFISVVIFAMATAMAIGEH